MNLTKLANISEIVSSIAIVITLFFLALQMQQNTKAIEASFVQAAGDAETAWILELLNDPSLVLLLSKEVLLIEESIRLGSWLTVLGRNHEDYWSQYQLGAIDIEALERNEAALVWAFSFKRARNWWQNVGNVVYEPGFVEHVNQLLLSAPLMSEKAEDYFNRIYESASATQ